MKKFFFIFLSLSPLLAPAQNRQVLILSDLHVALGKHWDKFYHADTDTALFASALRSAGEKKYSLVLMPGDLLRHVGDVGHDTLEMKETYKYITDRVSRIDTNALVLPALGNNDCITHDIPGAATYRIFYDGLLKRIDGSGDIAKTFLTGGYYAYQKDSLVVIALNSLLFMRKNAQFATEARAELDWLKQQLSALRPGQSAWLFYHVPPGTDRYDDVPSWQDSIQQAYLSIVKQYAPRIKFQMAGHTHTADVRLFTQGGKLSSYLSIAPGLDSRNGNNPAYQVLRYDERKLAVNKITTYYTDAESGSKWHSFDFKNLGFGFFFDNNNSNKKGPEFMNHYNTCRGTSNTKAGKPIEWDEAFRSKTIIALP
ncbi:metallophosphoesterase family protein [Mucilaginibacter pedocola]|uniref:Calcineurin-like phosphoesterase domain-containing protein n=1 Tax=Mucilaginibacter pedocola TaxID=1792845 RepID=A0A1S9PAK1_9SPHI|nr:metallophosphoesterase [Mucilaginibacter pedocola]OOQ57959.1 hypothetical protein BC343_09810 [Mucilaginibacter pedocola]